MVANLGTLSEKRVLVTKISQVEMPGEPKGLMGRIHSPSGNFLLRLTGGVRLCTLALQFGYGVVLPRDHGHFVT